MSENELLVEDWGGDIISVNVSARTGEGIDDLLENLQLVAEISELKANPDKQASGVIIEAKLDRKRGPIATVLVTDGTLSVGHYIVAGNASGRVRALIDDKGKNVEKVTPGAPAGNSGLRFCARSRRPPHRRQQRPRSQSHDRPAERSNRFTLSQSRALSLEEVVNRVELGDVKELNLVLKADVQGSLEAIRQSLERLVDEDAKVRVLHTGVGAVTESDVLLASASDGVIISFSIGTEPSAERLADRMGVEIRPYNIIYQLIDDIELALHGMLEPVYTEVVVGRAEIREIFGGRRGTQIAGCRVTDGRMVRNGNVRVTREGENIMQTTISSLRHFRDEVNEMNAGTECGIILQGFNDFQTGDILEVYRQERARR